MRTRTELSLFPFSSSKIRSNAYNAAVCALVGEPSAANSHSISKALRTVQPARSDGFSIGSGATPAVTPCCFRVKMLQPEPPVGAGGSG